VFVRQDIPLAQQIVQSNHATFELARRLPHPQNLNETPSCIVIGVPDKTALFRVIEKLRRHDIAHELFYEPDFDMGLSAVATVPLVQEQRRVLSNYRLWREPDVPTQANSVVPLQVNSAALGAPQ
jgi:hypothetical protein